MKNTLESNRESLLRGDFGIEQRSLNVVHAIAQSLPHNHSCALLVILL